MSTTVTQSTLSDPNSLRVKRKPAPVAQITLQPSHSSHQLQEQLPPQHTPTRHKFSFSEKYPDPDPTDPFAPLWVLRNRTTSVLPTDAQPFIGPVLQREPSSQHEFGVLRQADRRLSASYLHTLTVSPTSGVPDDSRLCYASDHGHGPVLRPPQRMYSTDDDGHGTTLAVKRQSMKPTRLSQVAPILPTISRSPITPVAPRSAPIYISQQPENDHSGSESDTTRVGQAGTDVDAAPRAAAQQNEQRPRTGSTNRLARFLKTRRGSQSQTDNDSHDPRASISDISRKRKASISPPVYSTVVWTGPGQDTVPIQDHPLHQTSIPILAPPLACDTNLSPTRSEPLKPVDARQDFLAVGPSAQSRRSPSPSLSLQRATVPDPIVQSHANITFPLPEPPVITTRPSQTSRTDETHSSFSFVHIPSAMSSPSLAQLAPEGVMRRSSGRPSTAPLPLLTGTSATITSPARMKIKRSTSRPTSKLPPPISPIPQSPLSPSATNLPFSSQFYSTELIGEWDLPTLPALVKAASLPIIAESGVRVTFGTLFAEQRAVVIFIRHFWCPLCQDYMTSVAPLTRRIPPTSPTIPDQDAVNEKADGGGSTGNAVKLIVISNGSYTMIGKYKQIFGAVGLEIYTDPSLAVYAALGMGKDPASFPEHGHTRSRSGQAQLHAEVLSDSGDEKVRGRRNTHGGYVKHGLMGGIAMVFVRALKVGMPVWEKGGDLNQLGGEFVLGPGLVCTYAHRMQTTKDHASFEDVVRAAGITLLPSRPLRPSKSKESKESKEKKHAALRKSRPSSDSTNTSVKVSSRSQSLDALSTLSLVPPQITTPISQPQSPVVPERKKSHRRRRSILKAPTVTSASPPPTTSMSLSAKMVRQPAPAKVPTQPSDEEKDTRTPTTVSTNPHTTPTPAPTAHAHQGDSIDAVITTQMKIDNAKDHEAKWMEERHRSLQKIKERKNARRGLSLVDERQATLSISASQSRPHSRTPSRSPPVSPSPSATHSTPPRQARHRQRSSTGMEKRNSRSRRTGSDGAPRSTWTESELGVQSDTAVTPRREVNKSGRSKSMTRRDDDDIILFGRDMGMSRAPTLGRDHARQIGKETPVTFTTGSAGVRPRVEDDLETVSDKTLVHQ